MTDKQPDKMRLDKWLWAARFFKTRQLAAEAISGGKVHLNGQRTKPGKDIRPGSRLHISEAATFYSESEESRQRREDRLAELRAVRAAMPVHTESKPNKRDRRLIHRFKQQAD